MTNLDARITVEFTIKNMTSECPGCLGVIVSVSCGSTESPIQQDVRARAQSARAAMVERLQRAIDEGDFTLSVSAEAMTQYLMAVMQGLAVQAGTGATCEQLQQVAEATLAVWPSR